MKQTLTNILRVFAFLFLSINSYAQKTDWIQGFDNNNTGPGSNMAIDNSNNSILVTSTNSSFTFKGYSLNSASFGTYNLIIVKYTSDDSIKWLYSTSANSKGQISSASVSCDENNNIYVLVVYTGATIKLTKNDSLIVPKHGTGHALLKFSSNGKFLWSREFGKTVKSGTGKATPIEISVSQNHVYFLSLFDGFVHFQGMKDSVKVTNGITIACYDTSSNFKFVNCYSDFNPLPNNSNLLVNRNNKNDIYFSGNTSKSFASGSITYNPAAYIFSTDTSGKIINAIKIGALSSTWKFTVDFNHPKKSVYIAFNFRDTFLINSTKYKISGSHPSSSTGFIRIDNFNKVIWTKNTTATSNTLISPSGGISIDKSYLYICATLQGNSQIGSIPLNSKCTSFNLCLIKFDSLGNVLWAFNDCAQNGSIQLWDSKVDNTDGSLYFTGYYQKKIKVFNDSLVNGAGTVEIFLAKVFDNSITRGNVKKGPYCAGDTFYVPYTKYGEYDTSNYFIAELSDENGDFETQKWELGRIKSSKAGTIIGKLPLFQVSSSENYRIRIRSTNPQVQSFYRRDSLRLLVYSRDKANPGPPETICLGETIKLNTYGGTKWKWSPKYNMDDDTKRQPLVWPVRDTTYKIIISDSSGCGAPDTAYKKITVLESPRADFSFGTVCSGTNTNFKFVGTTPKSPLTTSFNWNFNNEGSSTLENPSYKFTAGGFTTLTLTSSNGCKDFLQKNIVIKTQAVANFTTNDVCETNSVVFINKSKDATGYIWKFGDGLNNSTNSSILTQKHKYKITSSTTFNVTLVAETGNGCSDSIIKAVTVNANPKSDFTYIITNNNVDFKLTQSGNTAYTWYLGNGDSATGIGNFSYTYPNLSGKYTPCLRVINAAGCFSKTCKEISVSVGISAIIKPLGFIIYPNPNTGSFTIEIDNPEMDAAIEVYSLIGELVGRLDRVGKVTLVDLDVESGIYLVKVKNGGVVWNKKVSIFNSN